MKDFLLLLLAFALLPFYALLLPFYGLLFLIVELFGRYLNKNKSIKCACGKQDILGGAEVEIGGICHRPNNPCYIINEEIQQPKKHNNHFCADNDGECICKCYSDGFDDGKKNKIIEDVKKELITIMVKLEFIDRNIVESQYPYQNGLLEAKKIIKDVIDTL